MVVAVTTADINLGADLVSSLLKPMRVQLLFVELVVQALFDQNRWQRVRVVGDDKVRGFIEAHNPAVIKEMADRLLEAQERGLWTPHLNSTYAVLKDLAGSAAETVEMRPGLLRAIA